MAAVVTAEMHPSPLGAHWPPKADFGRWSFDPLQEKVAVYLAGLSQQGAAFRGTAPRLRLHVIKLDLSANPRPTVILSNCPTVAPTWQEYLTATGKRVPFTRPTVKPPYLVRIKMIKVDGRVGRKCRNAGYECDMPRLMHSAMFLAAIALALGATRAFASAPSFC